MIQSTKYAETVSGDEGEISYMTPEGHWLSSLLKVEEVLNKQKKTMLRLTIAPQVPDSDGVRFRNGRNFQPNLVEGSNLHCFLKVWLGKERLRQFIEDCSDWDTLIGERGIAEIKHVYTEGHAMPYVNIVTMKPVKPANDVTVNVPKPVIPTTDTRTTNQHTATIPTNAGTMTANASICRCCGSEIGRFSNVM